MRLAQLARKLSVKSTDIIQFLASQSIQLEDNANTKVEDDYVRIVISHFAPTLFEAQMELPVESEKEEEMGEVVEARNEEQAESIEPLQEEYTEAVPAAEEGEIKPAITDELPDIIRAPKIELTGLKVLGKIELPEKKKKEEIPAEEESEAVVTEVEKKTVPRERIARPDRKPKNHQRSNRNPLAEARERERREAEEKRKQEIERKKEIRTKNYLKKVQVTAPAKRVKVEAPKIKTIKVEQQEPKTLWGKFVKWLTTY